MDSSILVLEPSYVIDIGHSIDLALQLDDSNIFIRELCDVRHMQRMYQFKFSQSPNLSI